MSFFKSLSLKSKIMGILSFSLLVSAAVSITGFEYFNNKQLEAGIINNEKTIQKQLEAATSFVATQGGLSGVIHKMQSKYKSPDQLTEQDKKEILNQVPIYASLIIGKKNADIEHYKFRVFSDEPRNTENKATESELAIFKKFENNKSLDELTLNEGDMITTYTPIHLNKEQGCLVCHGSPSDSPWGNGKDILGHEMENWADGKIHGVFAISQSKSEVYKAGLGHNLVGPETWLVIGIVITALISLFFGFMLTLAPLKKLLEVSQVLDSSSQQVNSASYDISDSANKLSQATTEQAASLEQTASSLEQITAMIAKAADGAKNSSDAANESTQMANDGKQSVQSMMSAIDEIAQQQNSLQQQVHSTNQQMTEIIQVINEIGQKTKVINDIVFQTKLLSFNASVEAARAGEHGKGFAVVAEEVGSLAQMSGNAAKEISDMLQASTEKVEKIIQDSKIQFENIIVESQSKIDVGIRVANECAESLDKIVNNVERVTHLSDEISRATSEQSIGVGEINKAMGMLDNVTQQNATISEKTAQSSEELAEQSNTLRNIINDLLFIIDGQIQTQNPATNKNIEFNSHNNNQNKNHHNAA